MTSCFENTAHTAQLLPIVYRTRNEILQYTYNIAQSSSIYAVNRRVDRKRARFLVYPIMLAVMSHFWRTRSPVGRTRRSTWVRLMMQYGPEKNVSE